jgi:hypothetical protein
LPDDPARTSDETAAALPVREVLGIAVVSRLLVLATAMISATALSVTRSSQAPRGKVVPGVTHPFDGWGAGVLDAIFSPLVRWDAPWYLAISHSGYGPSGLVAGNAGERPAFFPLYPLLVHLLGGFAGDGATLVVATALSLATFTVGLVVVGRLAVLELGPAAARGAVLIIAFWPAGPFFSAPYTESLFLALSAGAFLAGRTDRWWLAALLAGCASATRNTGLLLVVPLAIMYFYGPRPRLPERTPARRLEPRYRPRPDLAWLVLIPAGLIAYCVYLQAETGNWQAWRDAQESFGRPGFASPVTTLHLALTGAYHSVADGLSALGGPNLLDLGALVVVCAGVVGMARRLPVAYTAWTVVAIAPALVTPFDGEALRSLPRFLSVSFPLTIWLGYELTRRRRLLAPAIAFSAALLVFTTAAFTSWLPYV